MLGREIRQADGWSDWTISNQAVTEDFLEEVAAMPHSGSAAGGGGGGGGGNSQGMFAFGRICSSPPGVSLKAPLPAFPKGFIPSLHSNFFS